MSTFFFSLQNTTKKEDKKKNKINSKQKGKKIPLRGFSLRRYAVTRYAVTRFTNNQFIETLLSVERHCRQAKRFFLVFFLLLLSQHGLNPLIYSVRGPDKPPLVQQTFQKNTANSEHIFD